MTQDELENIFGDILLKDKLKIPFDMQLQLMRLPDYQKGLEVLFCSFAKFEVNKIFESNPNLSQEQLEIILHFETPKAVTYLAEQIISKNHYNKDLEQRYCYNFVEWAIYREVIRKLAFMNHISLASKYNHKLNQFIGMIRINQGLDTNQVKEIGIRDPKRIGNNEQIAELKKMGLSFAREVLSKDTDKILTYKNIRELTLDYLKFKYQNSKTILGILPSQSDSLKVWFRKDDYTYPSYLSKRGKVSEKVKNDRDKLINQIKLEYFK